MGCGFFFPVLSAIVASGGRALVIDDHMGLVHHIANRCLPRCYANGYLCDSKTHYAELVQVGTIGLYEALKGFDYQRNVSFSTYAYPCIRNSMMRYAKPRKRYLQVTSYNGDLLHKAMDDPATAMACTEDRIDDALLRAEWRRLQESHPDLTALSRKKMKRSYYLRYRLRPYL